MGLSDVWKKELSELSSQPAGLPVLPVKDKFLGTTLDGKYLLSKVLDAGGMGYLYHAEPTADHPGLHGVEPGSPMVIKLLPVSELDGQRQHPFMTRFQREAVGMSQFRHPNIVSILDYNLEHPQTPYIVMEYVDGYNLKEFMKQFPHGLPLEAFLLFMEQICTACSLIHSKSIIHRDLKPHNIMLHIVDGSFQIKVLDFGLILFEHVISPDGRLNLTRKGEMIGTPVYMSPEQCLGRPITHLSDIYNLGLIAYEFLAGQPPFLGNSLEELVNQQVNIAPKPLGFLRPDLPPRLVLSIEKAMDKVPSMRYGSSMGFWKAIQASL